MGLGVMMYTQDYDEIYPRTSFLDAGGVNDWQWTNQIQPYVKNNQVFVCPSDIAPCAPITGSKNYIQVPLFSYITDYNVIPAHDWAAPCMAAIDAPAQTVMITERRPMGSISGGVFTPASSFKGCSGFVPDQPTPSAVGQPIVQPAHATAEEVYAEMPGLVQSDGITAADNGTSSQPDLYRTQYDRHLGGAEYIMADGHVKWYRLEDTLDTGFLWGTQWYPAYTNNK
jgi:prepilin-type processing-associated H-X9-DG protein